MENNCLIFNNFNIFETINNLKTLFMKIKKCILLILIIVFAWACGSEKSKKQDVELNVTKVFLDISNFSDDYIIACCDDQFDTIKINENGKFLYSVLLSKDSYLEIKLAKTNVLLYAKPNAEILIKLDAKDLYNSLSFSGDHAEINNYLAKQDKLLFDAKPNSESFIYAKNYSVFSAAFQEFDKEFKSNLKQFFEANPNFEDFVILEKERQKLINTNLILAFYSPLIFSEQADKDIENEIDFLINSTDKNNPNLLNLSLFYKYAENLIDYILGLKYREKNIDDISDAEYINDYFNLVDDLFSESEVHEATFYHSLKTFIKYYGLEIISEQFSRYEEFSADRRRLTELKNIFAEYDKLNAGNPSVDWEFFDINGNKYSSKDFLGKYIYIDVWASWCGPCIKEAPYFKEIAKKFEGKDIVFVSISVDESKNDWLNSQKEENDNIISLWAESWDNVLCNFFKIHAIPRFLLIDKQGLIINSNADRPSAGIEEVLNSLDL